MCQISLTQGERERGWEMWKTISGLLQLQGLITRVDTLLGEMTAEYQTDRPTVT
jgi:hypothetical protein